MQSPSILSGKQPPAPKYQTRYQATRGNNSPEDSSDNNNDDDDDDDDNNNQGNNLNPNHQQIPNQSLPPFQI